MTSDLLRGLGAGGLPNFRRPSLAGLGFGPLIICGAAWLIFWNESGAVRTASSLAEGARSVIEVSAAKIDDTNEGKLVHVVGLASSDGKLADAEFGVEQPAIGLSRTVEVYQWMESSRDDTKQIPGGPEKQVKVYEYEKNWSMNLSDSRKFNQPQGHKNPLSLPFQTRSWTSDHVHLEAFHLTTSQVNRVQKWDPLQMEPADQARVPEATRGLVVIDEGAYYLPVELRAPGAAAIPIPAGRPQQPQIGDLRVKFSVAMPHRITVVARQFGDTFEPYKTKAGKTIDLLRTGEVSAESLFQEAQSTSHFFTWLFRGVGLAIVWLGTLFLTSPVRSLATQVPLVARWAGGGLFLLSGVAAIVIWGGLVSVAWLWNRPLLAALVIGVSVLVLAGLVYLVYQLVQKWTRQAEQKPELFR